jgi:hypothetical protein
MSEAEESAASLCSVFLDDAWVGEECEELATAGASRTREHLEDEDALEELLRPLSGFSGRGDLASPACGPGEPSPRTRLRRGVGRIGRVRRSAREQALDLRVRVVVGFGLRLGNDPIAEAGRVDTSTRSIRQRMIRPGRNSSGGVGAMGGFAALPGTASRRDNRGARPSAGPLASPPMNTLATALTGLVLCGVLRCQQDPGTSFHYRVPGPVAPALHLLLHREFDPLTCAPTDPGRDVDVVVQPGPEQQRFVRLFPTAVLVARGEPYAAIAARRAAQTGLDVPDPGYFTTAEIVQEMDALVAAHPGLAQRIDLTTYPGAARTRGNQPIWALKVSDHVATDEDEPAVVIAAQHHARELNSPFMVIGAMRRVLQDYASDPAVQAVVDAKELWFVPCVNPDGVDHVWNVDNYWRKNRRDNGDGTFGVDLNRNYPTLWGACGASTRTSSSTYRGPSAGSEPETRTMRALVEALRPELYLDFHSSGREVLFPYPPCGSAGAPVAALLSRYVDALRTPMSYATRVPSASGEAPEDHWNSSGTLGFLTEISTSFQPVFAETVTEEARVWPGIRAALTGFAPALRGHVRAVFQGQPVAAEITYAPDPFQHGERARSRGRDGRYALWLPFGTWQVTWSAPGFVPATRSLTVTTYDQPQDLEIELVPAWARATLSKAGDERIGTTTTLTYDSPGDAGLVYWVALSHGTSPGIALGSRTLPLNADAFFEASLGAAPLLVGNLGVLPASAQAQAALNLPNLTGLVGLGFFAVGITFEPGYASGVKRWSDPVGIIIQP